MTMAYAPTRAPETANVLRLGLRARLRAVREARMASPRARTRLAEHLERAIARADRPNGLLTASVPVCRQAVDQARSALLDLTERLRAPRPVDPDGVRLARRLLVDGAGPLYVPVRDTDLRAAALRALQALDGHGPGS
jgi:hypothetical protein